MSVEFTLTNHIMRCLPATVEELVEQCYAPWHVVAQTLYRLEKDGFVTRVGKKDYGRPGPKPAVWDRA